MKPVGNWNSNLENKRYEYNLNSESIVLDLGGYIGLWAKGIVDKFDCKVHFVLQLLLI